MAEALRRESLFPVKVVENLINGVKGRSSLAVLTQKKPIPFNGIDTWTFNFDNEVDVVGESGKKTHGGVSLEPVTIKPVKIEYGARVSDEFMYASEEEKIRLLKDFSEGFSKAAAKGFDIMALHGINPRTGTASTVIGDNHFDAKVTQTVETDLAQPVAALEAAIELVQGEENVITGIALSPQLSSAIGKLENAAGQRLYPNFMFGATPDNLNGTKLDVNTTVAYKNKDYAVVGDFENLFRWGYAKEVKTHIIPYGDPDNTGRDLAGHNEIYIRAELYLGWGILDTTAFSRAVPKAGE